ncbi:MAG: YdbL family protein [Burkholderiales bacterium]
MTMRFARVLFLCLMSIATLAYAQADIEINTPAITTLKNSMQQRHNQLAPHYASGAVGLTRDAQIVLRDANAVPLPQRQAVNSLVGAENQDRSALYREIARANQHPEWESEIRSTFAGRWIEKAQSGWWVQDGQGGWKKK